MIRLREIVDSESNISSTRWAFAIIIIFDIIVIALSLGAFLVSHFMKQPLDASFFGYVATLLGTLTTIITASKALQGFEPKRDEKERPSRDDRGHHMRESHQFENER